MSSTRRLLATVTALAVFVTVLAVVPVVLSTPAAAKPAPMVPLPPCGQNEAGQATGPCPLEDERATLTASGRLSGDGATVTLTLDPAMPACESWDVNGTGLWSPSPCYNDISYSQLSGCAYLDLRTGLWHSTGCGTLFNDIFTDWRLTYESDRYDGATSPGPQPNCGATPNFLTYGPGGPGSDPQWWWSNRGPSALECRITWNGPSPDSLPGPTWMRFSPSCGATTGPTGAPGPRCGSRSTAS